MKTSLILTFIIILNLTLHGQNNSKNKNGVFKEYNYDKSLYSIKNYKDGKQNAYQTTNKHNGNILIEFYSFDTLLQSFELNASGDTIQKKDFKYHYDHSGKLISKSVLMRLKSGLYITSRFKLYTYDFKDSVRFEHDSLDRLKMTYHKDSVHLNCSDSETNVSFKGGDDQLNNFLIENLIYPYQAREDDISGVVIVTFTVNKDGRISDVYLDGPMQEPSLVREAIRVIELTEGKWIPGTMCGKNVNTVCRIPITFEIWDED